MYSEVSNPLQAIKATLAALLREMDTPPTSQSPGDAPASSPHSSDRARTKYATDMRVALERVEATLADMMDFRRLDAGALSLDVSRQFGLRALLEHGRRYFRGMVPTGVEFGYRVTPANAAVNFDGRRFLQIIANGVR